MKSEYFDEDLLISWLDFWLLGSPSLKCFPFLVVPVFMIAIMQYPSVCYMLAEVTVAPVLEVVETGVVGRLEDHVHPAEPWPVHPFSLTFSPSNELLCHNLQVNSSQFLFGRVRVGWSCKLSERSRVIL